MSEMKWISVEERLPSEPGAYIAFDADTRSVISIWFWPAKHFDNNDAPVWETDEGCEFDQVTHWTPLPAPPNEMTQKEGE